MADARPGIYASLLKYPTVPKQLIDGSKFLHWDDESPGPQAVSLRVDPRGHLLYWRDGSGYIDSLEIASIRDTRTGRSAKIPKDTKMKESCALFGSSEALVEDRTVSVVFGQDLVNIQWQNFVATSKAIAQEWCVQLFTLATNSFVNNPSFYDLLERTWTKLSVTTDSEGLIPLKNIYKPFASHKDDKKRIDTALSTCRLLSSKKDAVEANNFTMRAFLQFYACLAPRGDIDQVCREMNPSCKSKSQAYINIDQFVRLLNDKQRDPRLNEILYPYANEAKAREIIQRFEPDKALTDKDHLSSQGLHAYLISVENNVIPLDKLDLSQDMDQPLAHYFINSSHNTYLSGHQLTGKSSVELYRQVLLTGCRCVELDCWDGRGGEEEPVITHGFTMCSEVSFRETMEAIAETAFKVSDFPVILSFENHCSPKQQAKMVKLIKDYLGDRLLSQPLDAYPLKPGIQLPSPQALRGKFLIKNKKRRFKKGAKQRDPGLDLLPEAAEGGAACDELHKDAPDGDEFGAEDDPDEDPELRKLREAAGEVRSEEKQLTKEPVMLSEISAMVNYVEPAPFYSFEYAIKKNVSYECCSIAETNATNLLKESPEEFVNFNKRQVSRIYPKGTRVDSSNYMPQLFWNAGCQLVALNFQTPDLGLQLNLGIFHYQKKSGYLLKPEFMRRSDRRFDPFSESTVDGIVANSLSVRIISGYFLSEKRVGTYVDVEMYGLPADTVRKRFRTRTVPANGINPVFNQEPFVFNKVVLPHLATIRIIAYEESGKVIGQRILPVDSLRPGYRHLPLFSELMQPLSLATLFIYISVNDYVSDAFAELAAALANPIQYNSERDKHQQQLMVLTDDFDVMESSADDGTVSHHINDDQLLSPQLAATAASTADASMVDSLAQHHVTLSVLGSQSTVSSSSGVSPSRPMARGGTVVQRGGGGSRSDLTVGTPSSPTAAKQQALMPSGAVGGGTRRKFQSVYVKQQPSEQLHQQQHQQQQQQLSQGVEQPEVNNFVNTCLLSDGTCLKKLTMEEVMGDKRYQKMLQKCCKELHSLIKRNQKELQALHSKVRSEVAKQDHRAAGSGGGGGNSKKRLTVVSMRRHNSDEELRENLPLTEAHVQELRRQLESHAISEYDLQRRHQALLKAELDRALGAAVEASEKSLGIVYQQELVMLKKTQERQRNLETREFNKQFSKDKEKLKEVRKEFQRKQISSAVSELQTLDSLKDRRQRELREHNERLCREIELYYEEELQRLDGEKALRLSEAATTTQFSALMTSVTPTSSSAGRSLPGTPQRQT